MDRVRVAKELLVTARELMSDKWKDMPKGWTDASRKQFWESLTGDAPKHKVTKCIKEMQGKVDDPGAFCASLADRIEGKGWRSERESSRTAAKTFELWRRYGTEDDEVEVVMSGTLPEIVKYAEKQRLQWKPTSNIFGGYWYDRRTGDTYEIR